MTECCGPGAALAGRGRALEARPSAVAVGRGQAYKSQVGLLQVLQSFLISRSTGLDLEPGASNWSGTYVMLRAGNHRLQVLMECCNSQMASAFDGVWQFINGNNMHFAA
eukprot:1158109-Pelagomonas_calceolata.AAC.3